MALMGKIGQNSQNLSEMADFGLAWPKLSNLSEWVTGPERPKGAKDKVKMPKGPPARSQGPKGP